LAGFEKIAAAGTENVSRNKLQERYLKYRHYYAGMDLSGFGEYGKAVYAPFLPLFDRWFQRKSTDDIFRITPLLGDKVYFPDHPDFRKETGEVIDFHIKVLALSLDGVILDEKRNAVSSQFLGDVICDVSRHTRSYDFSDRVCFSITVRLFIEMLKDKYSHFGSLVTDLSLRDFANEDTLNPKPKEVINIPW
jgi:signal peptidase I